MDAREMVELRSARLVAGLGLALTLGVTALARGAVHQTDALQIGIYVLDPGGCIPPHRHSVSWDIALVLEGEIEARIGEGPAARVVRCGVHAMNLVPPGIVHTLRNPSSDAEARFLLMQSPSRDFDFLRVM